MTLRDWIIVGGLAAALPVWMVGVQNQWSGEPGATKRMLKACAIFAAIVLVTMAAAYLATCDPQRQRPDDGKGRLLLRFSECGVDLGKAKLIEDSVTGRHVSLKNHPLLNRKASDCIAHVLVLAEVGLRSDDARIEEIYADSWKRTSRSFGADNARKWLLRYRPELVLRKYPNGSTLQDYVLMIEDACGAPRGTARAGTEHKLRYVVFPEVNPGDSKTDCLYAALTAGLEDEDVEISRLRGIE